MLRGLSTISFFADDGAAAQHWYSELLGAETDFARVIQDQHSVDVLRSRAETAR